MRKFEIYLGGDNDNNGARWPLKAVANVVHDAGQQGASFIACEGMWKGALEQSWQVVLFSNTSRTPCRIAELLLRKFNQEVVLVVDGGSGEVCYEARNE